MLSPFRLALIQMLVEPGRVEANLARAEERVCEAALRGAQMVVLPETLDCGWTHPSAHGSAGPIPGGVACERLRASARRSGVYLCAGLVEAREARRFNAAVLFSPTGELLLHHRKIHELDFAQVLYERGDRLMVAHTPLGTLGVMICADAFAPGEVISRTLALMGAQLIISPCAWAVPPDQEHEPYGALWRDCYGRVALRHGIWIAGVSNVGPITAGSWTGRKCIGSSLVVGPDGEPVAQGPHGVAAESILIIDIKSLPALGGQNPPVHFSTDTVIA
ncbi:MAG: ramA 3 [Chthoniobacteraceae bacterium]|nr:ramA 3 [Chthoniobacteraceae bacterium]